jgi:CubicO group peptidase (beta-lactamase class C family)
LLALAVERATGEDFFSALRHRVLEPFNLRDVVVKPTPEQRQRIARTRDTAGQGTPSESYNSPYWQDLAIPWGGYYGTPVAVVQYAASFLPGHERGLRLESMRAMRKDHTGGVPGGVESAGVRWDHGAWGYGWEVKDDKQQHWTGTRTSVQTFCHWGQAGTLVWADPHRELAFAVFANRTVQQQLWSLKPPRWSELSDAVVQVADDIR